LASKLDKTVYIKSDSRSKFEKVVEVIDNIRTAGVDNLGLITEQIQQQQASATPAAKPDEQKK
jgi:biopolymer transport protein ExbD